MSRRDAGPHGAEARHPVPSARWVYGPVTDSFLGWCWLPFFLVAHALAGSSGSSDGERRLGELFAVVLLVSLVHQPLTLLLVYGDPRQLALHRRFFAVAPVLAVAAVAVAVGLDLWIVVPIAAGWNAVHTLQQRYGLLRIYARKARYGSARLDRAVVYVPFLAALIAAALLPQTPDQLDSVASVFGGTNSAGVRLLLDHRTALLAVLAPVVVAATVVISLYLRQERLARAEGRANPAKWAYLAGSTALLASLLADPLAGLIGYIAAHALEYVVVVARTLSSRYDGQGDGAGLLSVLASGPVRPWATLGVFLALLVLGARLASSALSPDAYLVLVYTLGVLHFAYDAVIWKVRRPAVAENFGITAPSSRD